MQTVSPISGTLSFRKRLAGIRLLDLPTSSASAPSATRTRTPAAASDNPTASTQSDANVLPLLTKISDQVAAAQEIDKQTRLQLQKAAIELALAAAECVASRCVEEGKYSISGMITKALESAGELESLLLLLNPADHRMFKALPQNEIEAFPNMSVQTDAQIRPGECRVQTSSERLSFSIPDRLESIRAIWMESLDDTAA